MKMVVKTRSMPYCTCPTVGPRVILLNVEPGDTVAKVKQALSKLCGGVAKLAVPPSRLQLIMDAAKGQHATWNDLTNDMRLADYDVGNRCVLRMKVLPQDFEIPQHPIEWKPFHMDQSLLRFAPAPGNKPEEVPSDLYVVPPEEDKICKTHHDSLDMLLTTTHDREEKFMAHPQRVLPSQRNPPKLFRTSVTATVSYR